MTIASGTTATATVPVFVFGAKGLLAATPLPKYSSCGRNHTA